MGNLSIKSTILGVKKFSGLIDGKTFDYCRLICSAPLDESSGNSLGYGVTEYDFGSSVNFEKFKDLTFPFSAELLVDVVVSGKTQKFKVVNFSKLPK